MKVTNPDRGHHVDATRGARDPSVAGAKGMIWRDASTESIGQIRDMTVVGADFHDNEDGTGILTISGSTPGLGTPPWFNPVDFGAAGDGTTDDTSAINDAIAAINTAGCGVLYFPCGTYLVTGALTTITANCTVKGDGMAAWDVTDGISEIRCTSQTAVLFTVTGVSGSFQDISLRNTYAGTPSSASRGVQQTPTTGLEKWDFQNVSVRGFYNNIDIGGGVGWSIHNCWIYGPVNYGIRIRNTVIPDGGDWAISDCGVFSNGYAAAAGIRIESSGGGKITNTKVNLGDAVTTNKFTYCIDVSAGNGVITSVLDVVSCSLENPSSHCFNASSSGTGTWLYMTIVGCQMAPYNSTGSAININAAALGDLDHVMIAGCTLATLIGSSTCAITLTNVYSVHILVDSNEFGGGVYCATGSSGIADISTLNENSGLSASNAFLWRPLLDGSGNVVADGSGQAVMAFGPA